ncbi:uncharacterized protein LOC117135036 [Drosophila busckii]|uniref:uncharacterized protein LOC117135036 n=1 Tax=Drosophila busckii TaxID=30019 RepID=UPI001432D757|nr:uncharacterized protein LOC117135036 [Drosophila busckii]
MDINDTFYDDLSSFISSPNDYGIDHADFDDILSSTISHLDPALDLNDLISQSQETPAQNDIFKPNALKTSTTSLKSLETGYNNSLMLFDNQSESKKLSTNLSEAPVLLPNLIHDGYTTSEIELLTRGNLLVHSLNRNTPSPTESCGSFSGSSTSGVHSDTSDFWQLKNSVFPTQTNTRLSVGQNVVKNDQRAQQNLNISLLQKSSSNIDSQVSINNPFEIHESSDATTIGTQIKEKRRFKDETLKPISTGVNKTKTIFLSSNDYKELVHKINLNEKKSLKPNGNTKPHIPKIVVKIGNSKTQWHQNNIQCKNLTKAQNQSKNECIFNGGIDEKLYKKHQRMIKNRESASLSRKKKKEYVVSLETRINNLEKENHRIKGENLTLRNQLISLVKNCKCRKGNACEFLLHSINQASKQEHEVKIAPKPASKSIRQHMNAATVKKNVAVLFAMAFMVTLNAGNFKSYLGSQKSADTLVEGPDANIDKSISFGRQLLWVESEEEYNEKLNRIKNESEKLVMPPLHFLRSSNGSKNAHWNYTSTQGNIKKHPPLKYTTLKCHNCASTNTQANLSDYSGLAVNLKKLINGNGYHNLSMHSRFANIQNPNGFKLTSDYMQLPDIARTTTNIGKRKIFVGYNDRLPDIVNKRQKIGSKIIDSKKNITNETGNFLKGIKQQENTFYVLSLNKENILLSSSDYNKNVRPKMSLFLPTGDPSQNGDIRMMQIDCEIFDTSEFELKSHMIPEKLRPNTTMWQLNSKNSKNDINIDYTTNKLQNSTMKYEKPRVRTYFMVGPKNQADASASLEKTRLVELKNSIIKSSKLLSGN